MTKLQMMGLSDDELLEIAKRKTKKGTHTAEADNAMAIRRERAGIWDDVYVDKPSNERMEAAYHGYTTDRYE